MGRTPLSARESVMKKGTWSAEEDRKLIAYVTRFGCWNWRQLPRFAGLSRCGKSCRLRWMNYLRPNIRKGDYSKEEEETILKLHKSIGNKWSVIAAHLPGRTDNGIKNYWNTKLKKREPEQTLISNETWSFSNAVDDSSHDSARTDDQQQNQLNEFNFLEKKTVFQNLDETQTYSLQSASELQSNLIVEEGNSVEFNDNFWADPFVSDTDYYFSTDLFDGLENPLPPSDQLLWGDSLFYGSGMGLNECRVTDWMQTFHFQ